ncbi:MAG: hypothetical protein HOP28_14950 [Gemmatimonadales bacterium]|nr:hypothetical protein [Gemmatimonadales bacterium]
MAKRIVADRGARGPFQGQADLDRVGGVGPGLLAALNERVKYGPGPPGLGGANRGISGAYGSTPGLPGPATVDLNLASEADLLALPGVGQARARAILAYRRDQGPFAALSDLGRVPGFSQSLVARLGPFVRVGR